MSLTFFAQIIMSMQSSIPASSATPEQAEAAVNRGNPIIHQQMTTRRRRQNYGGHDNASRMCGRNARPGFTVWMMKMTLAATVCFASAVPARGQMITRNNSNSIENGSHSNINKILCQITIAETMLAAVAAASVSTNDDGTTPTEEEQVVCIPIGERGQQWDDYYPIELPHSILGHHWGAIRHASLYVSIHSRGGSLNLRSDGLHIPPDAEFEVVHYDKDTVASKTDGRYLRIGNTNRLLVDNHQDDDQETKIRTKGDFSLALIRVSTLDSTPTVTAEEYFQYIFKTDVNIAKQFKACSLGKLKLVPALPAALDIQIDALSSSFTARNQLLDAASTQVRDLQGLDYVSELADKVFFMLPPIPHLPGFLAFSGIGFYRSVYNDAWATSLSATIHETGHGLGLFHAQKIDSRDAYSDPSGYMGAGAIQSDFPVKCFNGAHSWKLGWYKSHHLKWNPLTHGPRLVRISALLHSDRMDAGKAFSIVKVDDLHLIYNRAKGANRDTQAFRDELTITKQSSTNSHHMAALEVKNSWSQQNFRGSGKVLLIKVCESSRGGDYDSIVVSIGIEQSYCGSWDYLLGDSPQPTPMPTESPTVAPTMQPTSSPTPLPTESPTPMPTESPTLFPTRKPTKQPSAAPTLPPTASPTNSTSMFRPAVLHSQDGRQKGTLEMAAEHEMGELTDSSAAMSPALAVSVALSMSVMSLMSIHFH